MVATGAIQPERLAPGVLRKLVETFIPPERLEATRGTAPVVIGHVRIHGAPHVEQYRVRPPNSGFLSFPHGDDEQKREKPHGE